jgi:hypothetical protein
MGTIDYWAYTREGLWAEGTWRPAILGPEPE